MEQHLLQIQTNTITLSIIMPVSNPVLTTQSIRRASKPSPNTMTRVTFSRRWRAKKSNSRAAIATTATICLPLRQLHHPRLHYRPRLSRPPSPRRVIPRVMCLIRLLLRQLNHNTPTATATQARPPVITRIRLILWNSIILITTQRHIMPIRPTTTRISDPTTTTIKVTRATRTANSRTYIRRVPRIRRRHCRRVRPRLVLPNIRPLTRQIRHTPLT